MAGWASVPSLVTPFSLYRFPLPVLTGDPSGHHRTASRLLSAAPTHHIHNPSVPGVREWDGTLGLSGDGGDSSEPLTGEPRAPTRVPWLLRTPVLDPRAQ